MGVEAIIQSGLYGIRTSLDKELQSKIDLRNRLLSMQKEDSAPSEELISINNELDAIGLSQVHPNPYFSNFAKALSRNPLFRKPEFTADEYEEIQRLSEEMLNEILESETIDLDKQNSDGKIT